MLDNTTTPRVIGETPNNPLNSQEVCRSENAANDRQPDLTAQDERQITPERVKEWLHKLQEAIEKEKGTHSITRYRERQNIQNVFVELSQHADYIAEAYLEKCEHYQEAREEITALQMVVNENCAELERLQGIIDKQRSALNMAYGFLQEVAPDSATMNQVTKSLGLTQALGPTPKEEKQG